MATKTTTGGKKRASAAKKPSTRKKSTAAAKAKKVRKVDIYPNRMTVAVSALAGTVLLLVTIIAALGSRG